ncbi:MAG: PilZ domain-containing protein [Mesorhizobium sp.]|uniref:PilZ domain-containing protein n=1 Tax=Mesorhizobium sp. TaxID=1871066 RepID=UPI000FE9B602|nr:PilZ domain-containing protein [Mesorhizobium sp.]RWB14363.1 MAG: PilZ domain-containing protein [Mesorhizobium sp.]
METPPPDGPRREHRPRVLKGGTIITGFQNSEISCSLRNQHSKGAELRVASDVQIPERFLLYVPVDGMAYRTVVRWRKNERVGVEFVGTEPKPKFQYG